MEKKRKRGGIKKIPVSKTLICWKKNISQQVGLHTEWKAMRKNRGKNNKNKKQQQLMG